MGDPVAARKRLPICSDCENVPARARFAIGDDCCRVSALMRPAVGFYRAGNCLGLFSPTDERLTTPIYLPTYLDNLLEIARRLEATDICLQGMMPDPCKGSRGQELNPLFAIPMSTSPARFSGSFCS